MTGTSKKFRMAAVTVALVVIVAAMILPAFIRARNTSSSSSCINYLRQIDGAKQQWALESHKTTNDTPRWDEVTPYLKNNTTCPQGGTYILGRVDERPRCSIGGLSHTLPE